MLFKNSLFDEETGAFRHPVFDFFLNWEIRRSFRYRNFVSLVMLEPNIKLQSKQTLRELMHLITKNIRDTDVVGRLNGYYRFGIILLASDLDGAYIMAERLLNHINNYVFKEEPQKTLSISIGGACFPTNGIEKEMVYKLAEEMLNKAKQKKKKNKMCFPHFETS
ncbi:MAG: diguanylate cyclase [Candidatus Desulfofervidaceae bacterium]|nr:diguanylate cyclase [Candidatus Desulfofervidaceae bacterium]